MSKLTKKVGKINSSTGLQSGPISDEREFTKNSTKLFGKYNLNKYEESTPYNPPYKVYTALLTQTGTDAPVATILENTLGGTPVWTRTNVGEYRVTLTGAFITNKTVISAGNTAYNDPDLSYSVKLLYYHDNINSILWSCYAVGLVNQDDSLSKCPIEIRVYD